MAPAAERGDECARCGKPLDPSWAACPFCGRSIEGSASNERMVRIVGKLAGAISETALLHYERRATKEGDDERAEQLEVLRRTVREVTPLMIDAAAEIMSEARRASARRALVRAHPDEPDPAGARDRTPVSRFAPR